MGGVIAGASPRLAIGTRSLLGVIHPENLVSLFAQSLFGQLAGPGSSPQNLHCYLLLLGRWQCVKGR
jgi:hypothetical protein